MPKRAVQPGTGAWQFAIDDEDVQLFCDEASEQIEVLDAGLVSLEGAPDAELIQRIFRAAHTLKGSSLTIGHSKMASLTHAIETVLDAVRGGHRSPSREMIDALLAGVDALRGLAEEVTTRIDSGVDVAPLEAALLAILDTSRDDADAAVPTGTRAIELADDDRTALARLTDRGSVGLLIAVTIANSSQLPSVRCFQALQELDALGTVIRTRPERAIVEAAGAEFVLEAVIATTAVEAELRMSLESLSDVDSVTVSEFGVAKPVGELDRTPARPRLSVVPTGQEIGPPTPPAKRASQSVRIDVERLDGLMNLVGELVIDRTRLQQIREQITPVLKSSNLNGLLENLEETTAHLARVTDELQEEIMRSRMLPVRSVLARLPRLVRDVAAKCGKQVEFTLAGEDTELDRS
ncbi:MAG: Hpt domain-containing protein, partial [Tepidiformaceae bacterium]